MSTTYGERLRIRLFLEGVEVPVISSNIQAAPNSPIVASIQVPPLAEGTRLLPRTLVHLFFLDDKEVNLPFISTNSTSTDTGIDPDQRQKEGDSNSKEDNKDTVVQGALHTHYKLLFGGELMGFVWNKNSSQRSLVLQCSDWSNYWDYAYQSKNTGIFGPSKKAIFSGASTDLFTDFLSGKGEIVTRIIASGRCNSFPELGGLAAGIIRLMESIGGIYYPNVRAQRGKHRAHIKRVGGQNVFFSLAELRLHITHMVAAYEDDPTSMTLLKRQGWSRMFNRMLGGMGGQTSIRKVINALTGVIFHETYGQPCPKYVPSSDYTATIHNKVDILASSKFKGLAGKAKALAKEVRALQQFSHNQIATAQEGEEIIREKPYKTIAKRSQNFMHRTQELHVEAHSLGAPGRITSLLSAATDMLGKVNSTATSETWSPAISRGFFIRETDNIGRAADKLEKITTTKVATGSTSKRTMTQPPRLNQHILRPDIWFGAPPRCNVIFPEHYDSLSYQRMFMQEPTRLMLKTNDEFFGEDFLFDKYYFAPQSPSLRKNSAKLRDMLRRDVLDHELFTGILPVIEKMGEFNIFAGSKGLSEKELTKYKKIGFAQRSANFLYFKYRFNARQMQVGGRFNPYVACGFPGLIIDRYVDAETIRQQNELRAKQELPKQTISEALGTNFLGNFTQVSHSISQPDASGRTEIACSYPRQPEESVEFLGIEDTSEQPKTVRKKVGSNTKRTTEVAALFPPKLYSLGPNRGRIVSVVDVSDSYTFFVRPDVGGIDISEDKSIWLPLFRGGTRRKGSMVMPLVPIGVVTTAAQIGSPEVTEVVGGQYTPVVFKAFQVEEEVPRYRREVIEEPVEEKIRPGWYGDVWTNPKIGRVYDYFFGTGSITDPQVGTDGYSGEEASKAVDEAALAEFYEDPLRAVPIVTALKEGSSIQDAVEFLVLTYSYIKQNRLDVDQFISSYVWRPIATMTDMFGTTDLEFSSNGEEVLAGIEGFHSRAFGDYNDLFGLVSPEIANVAGIKKGSTAAQKGDTRRRKLEKVKQFVAALQFSRAILG